jgi:hypothetical protein
MRDPRWEGCAYRWPIDDKISRRLLTLVDIVLVARRCMISKCLLSKVTSDHLAPLAHDLIDFALLLPNNCFTVGFPKPKVGNLPYRSTERQSASTDAGVGCCKACCGGRLKSRAAALLVGDLCLGMRKKSNKAVGGGILDRTKAYFRWIESVFYTTTYQSNYNLICTSIISVRCYGKKNEKCL